MTSTPVDLKNGDEDRLSGPNSIIAVKRYFSEMALVYLVVNIDD